MPRPGARRVGGYHHFVAGAVARTTHYDVVFPHLSRMHDPLPFLAVPLIFLYVKALTARAQSFPRRDFPHFIPFILCRTYLLPYYLQSRDAKLLRMLKTGRLSPGNIRQSYPAL